ncbi:MAG: carboxypeptidase regulatory-like domain-containing protein, partial [Abitibacteriaceae bacterium]|nr:carboxypeptidase regulatory-like domain-containing protein [Abditibacteriaceae bacterium]
PDGDPKLQVTTDADGKFTLTSLPAGDVMVIAGYKGAVGEARDVNGKAPVSLKLQPVQPVPPSDIQRAYSLLEELWATTEGTQTYRNNIPVTLAAYDPDLAVKLASRKDGTINDSILSQIIAVVAKTDAARALEWAVPKVTQIKDGYSSYTAKSSLAFALADLKPDVAKGFYNEAKAFDKDQTAQNPKEYQGISSRATLLSRIAAKLHLKNEANQFAQVAINAINATPAAERTWMMGPVLALNPDGDGKAIAFNPDLGGKLLADLSAEPRKQVISNAITSSISYGDLLTARSLLDNLLEIEKQNTNGGIYSGSAKQSLVEALGKRDPAAALELAHNDSTRDTYNRAITLALAAQYQPKDVALQVLREAADAAAAYPSLDANSRVAAIAYGIDPKIGAEIFETAHTRLEAEKAQRESSDIYGGQNTSIADFAYYYSRLDPAESRLLLEAEFTRQKQIPRTTDNRWQYSNNLTNLIAAMAAVDIDRAMELTYLLPPPDKDDQWNNPQTEGQRLIAQYVLLSDAERRSKSFRDWDKSNGWQ